MKSIVLASSRGIGKGIADELESISSEVIRTSSKDLDTSDIDNVKDFVSKNNETDILVLNTGGPPAKDFYDITEEEWLKYYNQLFYSFVYMLQNIKVRDGGYIFLRNLVDDVDELGKTLPMGRVGSVDEIGRFVKSIIENDIKYLTGVTINFDGGHSNYVI